MCAIQPARKWAKTSETPRAPTASLLVSRVARVARARAGPEVAVAEEGVGAVGPRERAVDVARAARLVRGRFRHERHGDALLVRDLLEALLEDDVVVGHGQGAVVAHVELVLALGRLALGRLDDHARGLQRAADAAVVELGARALEQVVVLDVLADGLEVDVALGVRGLVAVRVDEVLELRRDVRAAEARVFDGVELAPEHGPRRDGDGRARRAVAHVALDERRLLAPRARAQRREVRREVEVAVALGVAEARVAVDGVHGHVHGREVVAGVRAVAQGVGEEEVGVEELPHGTAVEIVHHDHDRLDVARRDARPELRRRHVGPQGRGAAREGACGYHRALRGCPEIQLPTWVFTIARKSASCDRCRRSSSSL